MADRIPLIVNSDANQIQELPTSDSLQLNDSNSIKLGNFFALRMDFKSNTSPKFQEKNKSFRFCFWQW